MLFKNGRVVTYQDSVAEFQSAVRLSCDRPRIIKYLETESRLMGRGQKEWEKMFLARCGFRCQVTPQYEHTVTELCTYRG